MRKGPSPKDFIGLEGRIEASNGLHFNYRVDLNSLIERNYGGEEALKHAVKAMIYKAMRGFWADYSRLQDENWAMRQGIHDLASQKGPLTLEDLHRVGLIGRK